MLIILIYIFILIPQYIKYFLINKTLEIMNLYHDKTTGWEDIHLKSHQQKILLKFSKRKDLY